jgi:uroporphyrinogen III methyltransferase/synthase
LIAVADAGRPLAGLSILVTRPEGRADRLISELETLGAVVVQRPTIAFEAVTIDARARDALSRLRAYGFIVLTSPTGARFFSEALRSLAINPASIGSRLAVVGPGTALEARTLGFDPAIVARDSRAEGLAAEITGSLAAGAAVLVVRPEKGREVLAEALRAAGARVDELVLYRTVRGPGAGEAAGEIAADRHRIVVFSSPSTLKFLLEAPGEDPARTRAGLARMIRVAIGQVTAAALREAGLPAHAVAFAPTDEAVVDAIIEAARL